MNIKDLIKANSTIVENALNSYMSIDGYGLEEAMKYSLLSGGKRLRPFIVLETYKMFSESEDVQKAIPFACALEMIHTYSLIHDDLPCMDNDDYRRGKLTNHKVFGEANALLAGDALLTHAFYVLASNDSVSSNSIKNATKLLSEAAGVLGMIGGQVLDINSDATNYQELKKMHSLKTGMLIKCAVLFGYYAYCDKPDTKVEMDLTKFAMNIGVAFQIRDDILDKIADEKVLGKPVGSDEKNNKKTVLKFKSIDDAQKEVDILTGEAISIIERYSCNKNSSLIQLAKYLVNRDQWLD